jgi:hypothetical protein
MATQAQDTNWGPLFLAPLDSTGRRFVINCALNDPSCHSSESGLVNNLTILQQITLAFREILDVHLNQKANATGWETRLVQRAAAQDFGHCYTRSFNPQKIVSLEAPLCQRLLRGDPRRS